MTRRWTRPQRLALIAILGVPLACATREGGVQARTTFNSESHEPTVSAIEAQEPDPRRQQTPVMLAALREEIADASFELEDEGVSIAAIGVEAKQRKVRVLVRSDLAKARAVLFRRWPKSKLIVESGDVSH